MLLSRDWKASNIVLYSYQQFCFELMLELIHLAERHQIPTTEGQLLDVDTCQPLIKTVANKSRHSHIYLIPPTIRVFFSVNGQIPYLVFGSGVPKTSFGLTGSHLKVCLVWASSQTPGACSGPSAFRPDIFTNPLHYLLFISFINWKGRLTNHVRPGDAL